MGRKSRAEELDLVDAIKRAQADHPLPDLHDASTEADVIKFAATAIKQFAAGAFPASHMKELNGAAGTVLRAIRSKKATEELERWEQLAAKLEAHEDKLRQRAALSRQHREGKSKKPDHVPASVLAAAVKRRASRTSKKA